MKIEYTKQGENDFTIKMSDLTGNQLDAIRILLQTAAKYGQFVEQDELSLDKLLGSQMFK